MNKRALGIVVFALVLSGCGTTPSTAAQSSPSTSPSSATPTPSPSGLSMTQIDSLVRTLFYDGSQAYQSSLKQGFAYDLATDYPGSTDKAKYLACAAQFEAKYPGETISEVPEIDTLPPDPSWVGPPKATGETDWLFAGKKPNGQTYILTLDSTFTFAGQAQTSKDQVHVTIWNGRAYQYSTLCPVT